MSKYDKTEFTLSTLLEVHSMAIKQYLAAVRSENTASTARWHNECSRLERLIVANRKAADKAADKEFADKQNEAMRTTDMKKAAVEPLCIEDLWFRDGVAYGRTPSCGCCSEIMSSEADDYDYSEQMTDIDKMAAYVEQQEAKVQALREDFIDYCNSQENG